jgi:hypothetical protein
MAGGKSTLCSTEVQRFFADRGQASIMGTRDQLGVDAGWGTDRVPVGPEQGLDVVRGFTVQLLDRFLCSGRTAIGHDDLIDGVQTPECHSVQYPDPTDSREANAHAQDPTHLESGGARQRARIR